MSKSNVLDGSGAAVAEEIMKLDSALEKVAPADPFVTLTSGRKIHLREPSAGELRGVKLLDVLQLDTAAHATVIERISELSAIEFYALKSADALTLMSAVVGFFGLETASPPA